LFGWGEVEITDKRKPFTRTVLTIYIGILKFDREWGIIAYFVQCPDNCLEIDQPTPHGAEVSVAAWVAELADEPT